MDADFSVIKYLLLGFIGLIIALFVLALVFGKRIVQQWEYEAKFRDASNREFGELDIELSRIAKEETEDTFKATFKMRHATLEVGQRVQIYLDDELILEGNVEKAGRIRLSEAHIKTHLTTASKGQICRVVYGGLERFSQEIIPD